MNWSRAALLALALTVTAACENGPEPKSYPDFTRWTVIAPDQLLQDHSRLVPRSVATARGDFVVGGYFRERTAAGDRTTAAILRSADGRAWQRVSSPALAAASGASTAISALVNWQGTLVAVGSEAPTGATPDRPGRLVVWTSADGLDWTRLADQPAFAGWPPADPAVTVGPAGLFVTNSDGSAPLYASDLTDWRTLPGLTSGSATAGTALGAVRLSTETEPEPHGVVAVLNPERDGTSAVLPAGLPLGSRLAGAASTERATVVVGQASTAGDDTYAATWSTTDGSSWQIQKRIVPPADAVQAELGAVATAGDLFVLLGTAKTSKGPIGVIWTSMDGTNWTYAARAPHAEFLGLAVADADAVLLGTDTSLDGAVPGTAIPSAAVWHLPLTSD